MSSACLQGGCFLHRTLFQERCGKEIMNTFTIAHLNFHGAKLANKSHFDNRK